MTLKRTAVYEYAYTPAMIRASVAGASGYAGGELLRLIAAHPGMELAALAAGGRAGTAQAQLERLGYTNVRNAGGISQVRKERGCDATPEDDGASIPCPVQGGR